MAVITLFSVLPLQELVLLGGDDLSEFMSGIFDLGPGGFNGRPIITIDLGAHHAAELLNLLE
jgi:hypothetical protein